MRENLLVFLVILTGLFMFGTKAGAELIGGKVVNIDSTTNTITISQTGLETDSEENVLVQIGSETTLTGLESFSNIKIGDEIWAEAEEDEAANRWVASSIQKIAGLPSD